MSFQGLNTDKGNHLVVDAYQNTNRPGVYALGDVCGHYLLTPGMVICNIIYGATFAVCLIHVEPVVNTAG